MESDSGGKISKWEVIYGVPLATEPGISLIILPLADGPLLRIATIRHTTDTFLFISHTTKVLLFKFRWDIFNAWFGSEWHALYYPPLWKKFI